MRCSVDSATTWAVMPPSRLPAAVATSSSMPNRRFIRRLPARAAATTLDVAMTVVRLIAAADLTGNPRTSVRNGTRKMPPPRPSTMPRAPATAPAAKMTAASATVIGGTGRYFFCAWE